jgi:hypothetical protein
LLPALLANCTNSATCQQSALLLGSTSWLETPTPINASKGTQQPAQEPFTMLATQSAILCPQPVSNECLRENGTGAHTWFIHRRCGKQRRAFEFDVCIERIRVSQQNSRRC